MNGKIVSPSPIAASGTKDDIRRLVTDVVQTAFAYSDRSDDDARRQLRRAALKLASSLETPVDSYDRTLFEVNTLSHKVPRREIRGHRLLTISFFP